MSAKIVCTVELCTHTHTHALSTPGKLPEHVSSSVESDMNLFKIKEPNDVLIQAGNAANGSTLYTLYLKYICIIYTTYQIYINMYSLKKHATCMISQMHLNGKHCEEGRCVGDAYLHSILVNRFCSHDF